MLRTPIGQSLSGDDVSQKSPPKTKTLNVRRSIGQWEAAGADTLSTPTSPLTSKTEQAGPAKMKPRKALSEDGPPAECSPADIHNSPKNKYVDKTTEARACLNRAKLHLHNSRNLRTDIKKGVTEAVDRLYQLVKGLEAELKGDRGKKGNDAKLSERVETVLKPKIDQSALLTRMEEHMKKLDENTIRMGELKEAMERQKDSLERVTYAGVTANQVTPIERRGTLHSVVVASTDETESGEEVLERVRKVVDAKEGWIRVERVRKVKDRKVIMGFRTKEEQEKIKGRLEKPGNQLTVEAMKNKDPLLMLRDVFSSHTDEDVLKAFRNQNRKVFHGLDGAEDRLVIRYRRKARNPHTNHIIIATSPTIWRRSTEAGTVHIDLQHIRVLDQSPLVQCSRCLCYGHSKRFCKESVDLCSHCGGPHLKDKCLEYIAKSTPSCRNCAVAKLEQTDHNAFSQECPVRRKWDALARRAVAYC